MSDSFGATPPGFGDQPPLPPAGMPQPAGDAATFAQRLIARLIDMGIILALVLAIVIVSAIVGFVSSTLGAILAGLGYLVIFAAAVYMIVGGVALTGQSPGQRMQGVKIVTDSGALVGWGGSVIRWLVGSVTNSVLCGLPVGSLWMLWDSEKKTLYDKMLNNQAVAVEKGELMPIFPNGNPF